MVIDFVYLVFFKMFSLRGFLFLSILEFMFIYIEYMEGIFSYIFFFFSCYSDIGEGYYCIFEVYCK